MPTGAKPVKTEESKPAPETLSEAVVCSEIPVEEIPEEEPEVKKTPVTPKKRKSTTKLTPQGTRNNPTPSRAQPKRQCKEDAKEVEDDKPKKEKPTKSRLDKFLSEARQPASLSQAHPDDVC